MTQSEFSETKERVEKFEVLNELLEQLKREKYLISVGLLSIETHYQRTIDCTNKHEGFCDRLSKTLDDFYDKEIKAIEKSMEDI